MSLKSGGMFANQGSDQNIEEAKLFYSLEKKFMIDNELTYNKKHYIQHSFLQYITEEAQKQFFLKNSKEYLVQLHTKKDNLVEIKYQDSKGRDSTTEDKFIFTYIKEANDRNKIEVILNSKDKESFIMLNGVKIITKNKRTLLKQEQIAKIFHFKKKKIELNKKEKELDFLFGKAYDILVRHSLTSKQYIQENNETKSDYYNYAMYRINNYTIRTYKKELQTAFVYFTQTIKNAFAEEFKLALEQEALKRNKLKNEGLEGFIDMRNGDSRYTVDMEKDYNVDTYNKKVHFNKEFIETLKSKHSTKELRIIENKDAPRFNRKYLTYDNFISLDKNDKTGVIVEYIDLEKINENLGLSKNFLKKRCKIARDNGYQYLAFFSDIYLDNKIPDDIIWNKIQQCIEDVEINEQSVPMKNTYDPMLEYIPTDFYSTLKFSEPNWFSLEYTHKEYYLDQDDTKKYLDENSKVRLENKTKYIIDNSNEYVVYLEKDYLKRGLVINQQAENWMKLKEDNKGITRTFDCGVLEQ